MKKFLVLGIILLFFGVGFQPTLANEISFKTPSYLKDNCGCQPVNRIEFLKIIISMTILDYYTNFIISKFDHISVVEEKYKIILDNINSIGLNDIICNILMRIGIYLEELGKKFPIGTFLYPILAMMMIPVIILWNIFCD